MEFMAMDEAIRQIEKSNIDLEPEVLDGLAVRELLSRYAKAKKLVSYARPCWRQSSATLRWWRAPPECP
jgi:hypothetical protein